MAIRNLKSEAELAASPVQAKKDAADVINAERGKSQSVATLEKRIRALEDVLFQNTGLLGG